MQHFREVIEKSIPADNYTLIYEHGELTKPAGQYFDGDTNPQLGKFIRFEAQPNDPEALKSLLREQQKNEHRIRRGIFSYISPPCMIDRLKQKPAGLWKM